MNAYLFPLLAALLAYLLGSLSFAVIVSRAMGLHDPRTYGSKNPGATNVLRSGSKAAAAATLVLDAVKAWLPMALTVHYGAAYGLEEGTLAMIGLAAFLGHLFPVYFRFQGGKGVATALGMLLGISGWLGLLVALVWVAMAYVFRYSSLASLTAALAAPLAYVMGDGLLWNMDSRIFTALSVMSLLLMWRHAENISRLVKGTESKLGSKKK